MPATAQSNVGEADYVWPPTRVRWPFEWRVCSYNSGPDDDDVLEGFEHNGTCDGLYKDLK